MNGSRRTFCLLKLCTSVNRYGFEGRNVVTVGKDEFGMSFSWDSHEFPFKRSPVSYNVLSEKKHVVFALFSSLTRIPLF